LSDGHRPDRRPQLFLTRAVHWGGHRLTDPILEQAHDALRSPTGDDAYPERDRAFLALLRSGHPPAVAIALDHYQHADALTRHGPESPYKAHADEVHQRARDLLQQPPFPTTPAAGVGKGARHASALTVLVNIAEPPDAGLIAGALEQGETPDTRQAALLAARTALHGTVPASSRLMELLEAIVWNEAADEDERCLALDAIGDTDGPEGLDIVVRATRQPNPRLQVQAALILAFDHLEAHRDLVERLVDSWPANGDYLADQVRERLAEPTGAELVAVVRDQDADGKERSEALRDLATRAAAGDLGVDPLGIIVGAAEQPDLILQEAAVRLLASDHPVTHRALVERVIGEWPNHMRDIADELRDWLDEATEC
jgi:hypothetical protein